MDIRKEIIQIKGIVNVVCRDNGLLEVYYIDENKKEDIKREVLIFINKKCLNSCFIGIDLIQVPERMLINSK